MPITLQNTKNIATTNGVKMLVYGAAGVGKTTLCATSDNEKTLILSAEGGMVALSDHDIAMFEINDMTNLSEALMFINSEEGKRFKLICLDSISEIAEVCLSAEKSKEKNPMRAYLNNQETMISLTRIFRDMDRNVVMTAKLDRSQDQESGTMLFSPSCPGNKLSQQLPYFFDFVLAMRSKRDDEGKIQRFLQTQTDQQWLAKDRSGKLDLYENPDLDHLYKKITSTGGKNG